VFGCLKTVSFEPCSLPTTVVVLDYLLKKLGMCWLPKTDLGSVCKSRFLVRFHKINCSFIFWFICSDVQNALAELFKIHCKILNMYSRYYL